MKKWVVCMLVLLITTAILTAGCGNNKGAVKKQKDPVVQSNSQINKEKNNSDANTQNDVSTGDAQLDSDLNSLDKDLNSLFANDEDLDKELNSLP